MKGDSGAVRRVAVSVVVAASLSGSIGGEGYSTSFGLLAGGGVVVGDIGAVGVAG